MDEHGANRTWTYDDLASLPDDQRYEIIDGALVVMASPSLSHQEALKRLVVVFVELERRKLGRLVFAPFDVILSRTSVVQPDLLFVRPEREAQLKEHGLDGAPDLAIEIVSPSNTRHDRTIKRQLYARFGVREYWLVDPANFSIEVLELIEGGLSYREAGWYGPKDRARSATFDFEVSVAEILGDDSQPGELA